MEEMTMREALEILALGYFAIEGLALIITLILLWRFIKLWNRKF